jgi:3-hydroxyacyl-[acyl-carrier-protein] dehydratase
VPVKERLIDPSLYDVNVTKYDLEEIRKYNPQRYEFEQLTGVLYTNSEDHSVVGYKDLAEDEFWVRGHMPGFALMPGVLMCEAAAQLASFLVLKHDLIGSEMIGFGGMDKVRFRGMVSPGDRLIIACRLSKLRRKRMLVCDFQEFVGDQVVCEGEIIGIPLNRP